MLKLFALISVFLNERETILSNTSDKILNYYYFFTQEERFLSMEGGL